MPSTLSYPGVYVEEIPSGVRTITGVATSITAFVGRALRGPVDEPVIINNFGDFERTFGGLWNDSTLSFAVKQYFANGGGVAIIVRVYKASTTGVIKESAEIVLTTLDPDGGGTPGTAGTMTLIAAGKGAWGNNLQVIIDRSKYDATDLSSFDMTVQEVVGGTVVAQEVYFNLTVASSDSRYVGRVLSNQSALVSLKSLTADTGSPVQALTPVKVTAGVPGGEASDGIAIDTNAVHGSEGSKTGMYALDKTDLFNILCLPPIVPLDVATSSDDYSNTFWADATAFCHRRRAIVIVNPKIDWNTVAEVSNSTTGFASLDADENSVFYFPNVLAGNPLRKNSIETFSPCGIAAGIMARTDANRGVWKAPAGIDANILGIQALEVRMTDSENGQLNPLGVNCLRTMPGAGHVVWGARTMKGADRLSSEWKYLPVRRLALYIEESLYRGTQWVVFEPNDEPLWSQIRLNVGAFMHNLFRQGAFQGTTPRDAYFVQCDKTTTPQSDINLGIVNIMVGFAPLKPAEFVVIKLQQMAGQIEI
ncbi:MAG: tail sheath protein [Chlorobi bacterium]|nr:tail sheath protein [Chlorobiota bacterium]